MFSIISDIINCPFIEFVLLIIAETILVYFIHIFLTFQLYNDLNRQMLN